MISFKKYLKEKYAPQEIKGYRRGYRTLETVPVYMNPNVDEFKACFSKAMFDKIIRLFKVKGNWYIWPAGFSNHYDMAIALGFEEDDADFRCGIQMKNNEFTLLLQYDIKSIWQNEYDRLMNDDGFKRMSKGLTISLGTASMF